MNSHVASVVLCTGLAFSLGSLGPADVSLARYILEFAGGTNCNASDSVTHDCVELQGHSGNCANVEVGADTVQTCKDEYTISTTVCTENLCENVTKDKLATDNLPSDACTKQGCGS
jgi:hypothetical protein